MSEFVCECGSRYFRRETEFSVDEGQFYIAPLNPIFCLICGKSVTHLFFSADIEKINNAKFDRKIWWKIQDQIDAILAEKENKENR